MLLSYVAEWALAALQLAVTLNLDLWASPGEVPEHREQEFQGLFQTRRYLGNWRA